MKFQENGELAPQPGIRLPSDIITGTTSQSAHFQSPTSSLWSTQVLEVDFLEAVEIPVKGVQAHVKVFPVKRSLGGPTKPTSGGLGPSSAAAAAAAAAVPVTIEAPQPKLVGREEEIREVWVLYIVSCYVVSFFKFIITVLVVKQND